MPISNGAQVPHSIASVTRSCGHRKRRQVSLFELIPGSLPKLRSVREIGSASAELCAALAKVTPQLTARCPTPPYYELFKVHHAVDRDSFYRVMASSEFDHVRPAADRLVAEVQEMEAVIERLLGQGEVFPRQLIHGDLHYDNVLVKDDGGVSGLLDFEFCAIDWRVMELAVSETSAMWKRQ